MLILLGMSTSAVAADFKDFAVDLRDANGGILTPDEVSASQTITFGLSVDENGAVSRVAADAANAVAVITGKAGNNHGLQSFSATVPVSGSVKITMSTCSWGGDVTVKNAAGETVASFTTKKGEGGSGCYKGNGKKKKNIVSAKYVGEATTLLPQYLTPSVTLFAKEPLFLQVAPMRLVTHTRFPPRTSHSTRKAIP